MEINMTLVIQGCNFFVTYVLLRKFLFSPTVKAIYQEQSEHNALIATIQSGKTKIEAKQQEKRQRWQECQQFFVQTAPPAERAEVFVFEDKEWVAPLEPIQDNLVKQLTNEVEQAVIKKVVDVH